MRVTVKVTGRAQIAKFLRELGEAVEVEIPEESAVATAAALPSMIRRKMEGAEFGSNQDGTPVLVEDGGYARSWLSEVTPNGPGSFVVTAAPTGADEDGIEYSKLGEMLELGTRNRQAIPHIDALRASAEDKCMKDLRVTARRALRRMK